MYGSVPMYMMYLILILLSSPSCLSLAVPCCSVHHGSSRARAGSGGLAGSWRSTGAGAVVANPPASGSVLSPMMGAWLKNDSSEEFHGQELIVINDLSMDMNWTWWFKNDPDTFQLLTFRSVHPTPFQKKLSTMMDSLREDKALSLHNHQPAKKHMISSEKAWQDVRVCDDVCMDIKMT